MTKRETQIKFGPSNTNNNKEETRKIKEEGNRLKEYDNVQG